MFEVDVLVISEFFVHVDKGGWDFGPLLNWEAESVSLAGPVIRVLSKDHHTGCAHREVMSPAPNLKYQSLIIKEKQEGGKVQESYGGGGAREKS